CDIRAHASARTRRTSTPLFRIEGVGSVYSTANPTPAVHHLCGNPDHGRTVGLYLEPLYQPAQRATSRTQPMADHHARMVHLFPTTATRLRTRSAYCLPGPL